MGIRKYKPTTPGRRGSSVADFVEITRSTPEKSLVRPLHSKGGRNNAGRVTARHQGGGHKRAYRLIDFRRNDKDGVPAKVAHIEYDPNRTARIALLHYADGEKRYIIAPNKLKQGDVIETGPSADIKPGNCLPMRNIPVGTVIHAVELKPGGGAKIARSAGASIQLVWRNDVTLLAVRVMQQCNTCGAVRIVFNVSDLGRHTIFVRTLKVNDAVSALVAATLMSSSDATAVIAATLFRQWTNERLLRL